MTHELRPNYWFIFYSERLDTLWILSSAEFCNESNQNKGGENVGKRMIKFTNLRVDGTESVRPRFKHYVMKDFSRILQEDPDAAPVPCVTTRQNP